MSFNVRTYRPPGPVAEAFLRDRSPVRFIKGPIGSGKTNACFFDALTIATQMPKCIDGKRRFQGLIFRDTYGKLWDTVIKSWWQWFPESAGKWSGQHGRLASHLLRFDMADGGTLEFHMQFRALDENADIEDALKGVEVSWAQLNEADTLNEDVLTHVLGRVEQRRFPPQRMLPPEAFAFDPETGARTPNYFAGVVGDLNPPDVDNWVYELFEEKRPKCHRIFDQPSGRSPRGENREGVSLASYQKLAELNAHKPWWVMRMVDGKYGYSRDGQPVYPGYQDDVHSVDDLEPVPGVRLRLSFDQGVRGPAMVVRQFLPMQVRVLSEYVPGHRMGPTAFGEGCRQFLLSEYPDFLISRAVCDLAGFAGGDKEKGDRSWAEIVAAVLDLDMMPAPTNEIQARIDGVAQLLSFFPDGKPAIVISRKCKHLRKGFNSHYRFKVDKNSNTPDPVPEKNLWSNPHDALQYGVLDDFGLDGVLAGAPGGERGRGLKRRGGPAAPPPDDDDEDIGGGRRSGAIVAKSDFDVFKS